MSEKKHQRGLGRGLSSLLSDFQMDEDGVNVESNLGRIASTLPIEFLVRNENQPRQSFDPDELNNLADSIRQHGVIQPILVRKIEEEKYEIVAGERRWRAASLAQQHDVPVIIREFSEIEVSEIALIENIQRANLSPIEEAKGYQSLLDSYNYSQEELSKSLGKSRSHIANSLRLLKLDPKIQSMVDIGDLSFGHAKVLMGSENALQNAELVVRNGMSVRALEAHLTKKVDTETPEIKSYSGVKTKDADTRQIEEELKSNIGMKVNITHGKNGAGNLTINYKNLDQLDRICEILSR